MKKKKMGKKMDYEGLKYIKGSKIVFFVLHRNYQKVGHTLSEEIILNEGRMIGRATRTPGIVKGNNPLSLVWFK